MPRLFFAFALPEDIKDELARLQDLLRPQFGQTLRFTSRDNLHLTLKFLGQTSETDFARLREALPGMVRETAPFQLRITNTGVFPPRGRPRVVWVGPNEHSELAFCHHQVETTCAALGFAPDARAFSPHITLARVRDVSGQRRDLRAYAARLPLRPCDLFIAEIVLFESRADSHGSTYDVIERVRFGANCAKS